MATLGFPTRGGIVASNALSEPINIKLSSRQRIRVRVTARPGANVAQCAFSMKDGKRFDSLANFQAQALYLPTDGSSRVYEFSPAGRPKKEAQLWVARDATSSGDVQVRFEVEVLDEQDEQDEQRQVWRDRCA